ncbi:hypothetical protein [Tsuneonella amylolytica]|uniref:hypothetical protein n=1 Tax=Tsuneonella amylolytica TaxID=2338327 RepID=UPI000EAA5C8C|nr:hypothetical protein [Tsuneonella amylolytica]
MITLRTAREVDAFLVTPLGRETEPIIRPHLERLADYEFEDIAAIAVGKSGETPAALGLDPDLYEYREEHTGWTEEVFIVSDDGFGWIVLIRS